MRRIRGMRRVAPVLVMGALAAARLASAAPPTYSELLARLPESAWTTPAAEDTLYLDLEAGRVVIALSPDFAPHHADNIRKLARAHFFDGSPVTRVQDNYVTQWGGSEEGRPLPAGVSALAPEFDRPIGAGLPFTPLVDGDVYAPLVGHTRGFPVARDPAHARTWLAHCYAMVGVGRDMAADSGTGEELYVVIGHAPRHLDRNVTLVGRVLSGMELLSELPRGTGQMGVYEPGAARARILSMRVASDVAPAQRVPIQVIDTSGPDYARLVEARRNRHDEFFKVPAGRIDLCNAPLPVRLHPAP